MNLRDNPFSRMLAAYDPRLFFGREQALTRILQGIGAAQPTSFSIVGIRTIGKTSLLRYLIDPQGARERYADHFAPRHKDATVFVLVDYDEDLFAPPDWVEEELAHYGIEWIAGQHRSPDAVLQAARGGDVVMIQSVRPLLDRGVIQKLEQCRCIVRLGIGYENVAVDAATEQGIMVCNVPTYCIDDVADHALALLMAGIRHIARQDR